MDYQVPIIEAWALYPTFDPADGDNGASLFLLSLGDHSAVLQLSGDAGSVRSLEQNNTKFDLRYRTVAANMSRSATAQVTEQSIVLVNGSQVQVWDLPIYEKFEANNIVAMFTEKKKS